MGSYWVGVDPNPLTGVLHREDTQEEGHVKTEADNEAILPKPRNTKDC